MDVWIACPPGLTMSWILIVTRVMRSRKCCWPARGWGRGRDEHKISHRTASKYEIYLLGICSRHLGLSVYWPYAARTEKGWCNTARFCVSHPSCSCSKHIGVHPCEFQSTAISLEMFLQIVE